jgi:predicted HicB family RNase H-like nuclease
VAKVSVFLDEKQHKSAKRAAIDAGVSLTRWISALVDAALKPNRK